MLKKLIVLKKVRLGAVFALAAWTMCVLFAGTSAAFSDSTIAGGYGCLGSATLDDISGTLKGIFEVMHLNFDGAGHVGGAIVLNLEGEVCNIATTGTYFVKPSGLATMKLTWNTATGDADGDVVCSSLNAETISQHAALVVENGGGRFDFQASDDFLTTPLSSADDDIKSPFIGSCTKQ